MTTAVSVDPRAEFSIPPAPVLVALIALGPVLYVSGELLGMARNRLDPMIPFTFVMVALAVVSWGLLRRWDLAGRWATVAALAAGVWLGAGWLRVPGFVALLPLPVILATTMIGVGAGAAAALAGTALALAAPRLLLPAVDAATVSVMLAALWGAWGMACATVQPLHRASDWLAEYFDRAQTIMDAARERKAQLEETLQAFAHANRQLALANERTATLRAIAEEAERAKAAFVANVSHELRTPLNIIIGLVDVMVRNPEVYSVVLSPRLRKDLATVQRNCEHLSHMVSDVLDLSRAQAGRLPLQREQVALEGVIAGSVEVVRPLLDKKGLSLRVLTPPDLPSVYCDRTRIEQVILNLTSNAARFTEEGGVEIEAQCVDGEVTVRVTDTGPGIRPEDAQAIFEPFSQGGAARRDRGGTGLGLSISKEFVERHGGRMWLESEPGVGTSFLFTLPVSPPMDHVAPPGHMIREEWIWRESVARATALLPVEDPRKPRLLVLDAAGELRAHLERYSDQVEMVPAAGLADLRGRLQECPAHAVLLNATAPGEAWALAQAAREAAPGTPVIVCAVPPLVFGPVEAGVMDYLIKPVARDDLERVLSRAGRRVRRVLVVDDNPDALGLFQTMLHACEPGMQVAVAANGEEALAMMRAAPPDLALLDVVMPGMDGWQVVRAMEADEALGDVPVVFVSATDPTDRPPQSPSMLATISTGLSIDQLLRCAVTTAAVLLQP